MLKDCNSSALLPASTTSLEENNGSDESAVILSLRALRLAW